MRCFGLMLTIAALNVPLLADDAPTTEESVPATRPATEPSPVSIRLENRQLVREEFDPLPKLKPATIDQVIHIALDGGHLHVTAPLPPTDDAAVPVTDWSGATRVNIGPADSLTFHLKHVTLLDTDLTMQVTEVFTQPDYLQIVRDTETPTGVHSVTLIQSRQFAGPNANPIRVLIHDTRDSGSDMTKTLNGESFEKLRQTNAADLRHELLPILRDLGAATLLQSISADAAWQVLGIDVPADAATNKQLDQVIGDLSADDFSTRTKAEETLSALGPMAASALARRDLSKLGDDPRAAVDNFLHRSQKLDPAVATGMLRDSDFLLDTIAAEIDPRLTEAAITRLKGVTGKSLDLPASLSAEERAKRIDAFRTALSPATQPS